MDDLEQQFLEYKRVVYHTDRLPDSQETQIKMGFFGGASSIMALIFKNVSTEPGCTEADVEYVEELMGEIQSFSERIRKGENIL